MNEPRTPGRLIRCITQSVERLADSERNMLSAHVLLAAAQCQVERSQAFHRQLEVLNRRQDPGAPWRDAREPGAPLGGGRGVRVWGKGVPLYTDVITRMPYNAVKACWADRVPWTLDARTGIVLGGNRVSGLLLTSVRSLGPAPALDFVPGHQWFHHDLHGRSGLGQLKRVTMHDVISLGGYPLPGTVPVHRGRLA